ncbi:MAG TPA: hypothetical protein VG826_19560 [Pirellulales bacterium]|nr:hypothetical protein [Pirellulales bacterium]
MIHFDNEWSAMGVTDGDGFVKLLLPQGCHELSLGAIARSTQSGYRGDNTA